MKILFILAAFALSLPAGAASTQQNKMKECNTQATGLKGTDRSNFMKKCLSNSPMAEATPMAPAAPAAPAMKSTDPKQRMKDCNMQGKGKKGDERKKFMSSCLRKDAAPAVPAPAPARM